MWVADTSCDRLIRKVTTKKWHVTGILHFLDFWCKVVLINFNLMAKEKIKKNLVIEETKGPKNLQ
jgi:hypothetical protein